MAKGKGRKGKRGGSLQRSQKVEKEYKMLTLEEQQARDAKYAIHLADLRACLTFIDDAFIKVEELKEEEDEFEKWQIYLRCDGLPKPYIPPDVRLFFEKLKHFEGLKIEKTIDWLLSVDERSVLTQDIFSKDMTRRTLVNEIRPDFGDEYKENIDLLLRVIKSIEYYLDDDTKTVNARNTVLEDISKQKTAAYREIENFFDHYAYRILCSEDSYMDSVNATTAEYAYECENFCIHIWTFKNVPILFGFLEIPCIEASLHKLKVKIQMPLTVLEENLTIRGIHFFFDPFSENAKSFKQEIQDVGEDFTAGIPDLHDCLVRENFLQVDLQNQVRNKLMEKRVEYENKAAALAEQLESLKKSTGRDDANKKKQQKLIKVPKEPPIITAEMYPDVWDDFLQLEHENFNKFIDNAYHPSSLRLEADEINLKQYTILGGIYQFYFVKKSTHYHFNDFNMTWHKNNGQLQIIKDVIAEAVLPATFSSMTSEISGRRSTAKRLSQPIMDQGNYWDTPYFVISIDLPEYLCIWGEPLACHFEDDLIGYIEEKVPTSESYQPPTLTGPTIVPEKPFIKDPESTTHSSVDFFYTPRQSASNISVRVRRSILNVFRPSLASIATSAQQQSQSYLVPYSKEVENFLLDLPLTVAQIRNIQRYCMPRIISSFKFPVELEDEETERGKPKGKGGILLRKRLSDEDQSIETAKEFQYDGQNNPERIFPYFVKPEKLHFEYYARDQEAESAAIAAGTKYPKTFSDLVQTLDNIKSAYHTSFKRTVSVPDKKIPTILLKLRKKLITKTRSVDSTMTTGQVTAHSSTNMPIVKFKSTIKRKTPRMSEIDLAKMKEQKERDKERLRMEREMQALRKQMAEAQQKADAEKLAREEAEEEEEAGEEFRESAPEIEPEVEDKRKTFRYSHWTTKYIKRMEYEKENKKIIIWTDRLGTIGLAYKLYEHFPFKDWKVEPSLEKEGEVIFTLETQFVICVINISANGYRGYVAEPTKGFVRHRKIYLDIKEPITDFKDLKKRFREHFLNIFSNHDARFYIENGYFSEKHLACELHIYSSIALHCLMLKFARSDWNRLAKRRDIVLNFAHHRESPENMIQVRITPENATFVDIKELCSDNLDVFLLDYGLTWRNIDQYSDFHQLIMSTYLTALDNRCRDPKLLINVKKLLSEIRPLSYS